MCRNRVGLALVVIVVVTSAAVLAGCGAKRQLVSITVVPNNVTFGAPGLIVNYKAYGNFNNPVETRDITNSVLWTSAAPQVISIDPSTGVATSGEACGTNITISAIHYHNQQAQTGPTVVGRVVASVTCP